MATLTLWATADNEILMNSTSNDSTNTEFVIGESDSSTNTYRLCIKFDLSGLTPNEQVDAATLKLYKYEDYSSNVRNNFVYRLKRAWVSTDVTWEVYSAGNSWATAGGFGADDCEQTPIATKELIANEANGFKEWSLDTDAIQAIVDGLWTNNGFLVKTETESNDAYRYYSSKAATTDYHPQLVIQYSERGSSRASAIFFH